MKVGSISGSSSPIGGSGAANDKQLQSIQKQIKEKQDELKKLSANQDIPADQKQEKQKMLREQITELQRQYTERQQQITEERAQKSGQTQSEPAQAESAQEASAPNALSKQTAQALISSQTQLDRVEISDAARTHLQGKISTLKAEIKSDANPLPSKMEEVAKLEGRVEGISTDIAGQLNEVQSTTDATQVANDKTQKPEESEEEKAQKEKKEEDGSYVDIYA